MYYFIVNPLSKSGRGRQIWERISPILDREDVAYKLYMTKGAGDAAKIAQTILIENNCKKKPEGSLSGNPFAASPHSCITLVILGGDGTVNEIIQTAIFYENVLLAYVPTGSSNDLARDLGINKDPVKNLYRILGSKTIHSMDAGQVDYIEDEKIADTHYFAVSCGIGFDAAVCQEAMHSCMKGILNCLGMGKLTYLFIAIRQIFAAAKTGCTLVLDDEREISLHKVLFAATMIHRYEGGGFMFCPDAVDDDGYLDLCIAGDISVLRAFRILPTAFKGKHTRFSGVEIERCRKLLITASSPLWVHTDGEISQKSDKIYLTCQKNALQFIV